MFNPTDNAIEAIDEFAFLEGKPCKDLKKQNKNIFKCSAH